MNDSRYSLILYGILIVILSTIGIQAFWNYKNYGINKQQLVNDVQISLDNAVDAYYTDLAEKSTIGFAFEGNLQDEFFEQNGTFDSIIKQLDVEGETFQGFDSIDPKTIDGVSVYKGVTVDSILNDIHIQNRIENNTKQHKTVKIDSISTSEFNILTSKVVVSLSSDSLNLKKIDSLVKLEFQRKNLNIDYGLNFKDKDLKAQKLNPEILEDSGLSTTSKSSFLPKNSRLEIHFTNETKIILKRILSGILISTLLVLAVISCLFYLLKIIKHQKQLAEVKNDLISNITHEFKTPIATISVALESIKNFNVIDDKEKTKTYLNLSSIQLSKLNVMVEKLLETATLDSDNLDLNKETVNITELLDVVAEKHQMQTDEKTIHFNATEGAIMANVDLFHFENAINNIIDNAIKYGGDNIFITLKQNASTFTVDISDNGNTLSKAHKNNIFEKFYRVPKGNTHDVKGFGIGLYYTKKIIEKHSGTIILDLDNALTTFKITLPNE